MSRRSDGLVSMGLLSTLTTVAISEMEAIVKLKPDKGGAYFLSETSEIVIHKGLDAITLSVLDAMSKMQDSDRAPFMRAMHITIYGFLAIVLAGRTNRGWRGSFFKCWKENTLRSVIATEDEAIAAISLVGMIQTGPAGAKRRAENTVLIDTELWGYLLHDILTEIDNGGKATSFAQVLYMQMVTAIRPRHHHTMALDDSTIKFVEINKTQYNTFIKPLAKFAGFKPKSHTDIIKMFVLLGLHDGTKDLPAFRVLAIHKKWLPQSVSKSTNQSKALCIFLQSCSEVHSQATPHEELSDHVQFHLAGKPHGSTRTLFKSTMSKLWPPEYTKLTSLVRAPATQFQVAAFCKDLNDIPTLKLKTRAIISSKILAHAQEESGWYYIWAEIDGVGTYNWFRGPRPAGAH